MATVKGVWVFNETISSQIPYDVYTSFTSNDAKYFRMTASNNSVNGDMLVYEAVTYVNGNTSYHGVPVYFFSDGGWAQEAYRTVEFGETEQEVSEEFYEWLTANATEHVADVLYSIYGSTLTSIAEEVRRISGLTGAMSPSQIITALQGIAAQTTE